MSQPTPESSSLNSPPSASSGRLLAWICALTIFASALLVFQVQPVIGKMLLPWFGGSPAVWTACLLFFQAMLLAGYAYAHVLARLPSPRRQALVHAVLVSGALLLLPITPDASWKPTGSENPTLQILLVLLASVGAPYCLLSATAPLIQHWYGHSLPGRSPYRLYALSNVGSLLALLSYPVLIEPFFSSPVQGTLWSGGYAAYAILLGATLVVLWKMPPSQPLAEGDASSTSVDTTLQSNVEEKSKLEKRRKRKQRDVQAAEAAPPRAPLTERFPWLAPVVWFALPALASVLLVAVTNHVCQDVAVVPFLWVVPLSLYLLTFIICFDSPRWYLRIPLATAAVLTILLLSVDAGNFDSLAEDRLGLELSLGELVEGAAGQTLLNFLLLFFVAMLCHGELVRWKPHVRQLTAFYLSVSAGGALGGVLVAVVCPLVFTAYHELPLAMMLGFLLAVVVILDDNRGSLTTAHWVLGGVVTLGGLYIVAQGRLLNEHSNTIVAVRNFYGTLSVQDIVQEEFGFESDAPDAPVVSVERHGRVLYHGRILHGFQFLDLERVDNTPTTYYAENSGVGRVLDSLPADAPHRIGVVGLGTGTLAAYGRAGDDYVFYEINPAVPELARNYFSFLDDSPAKVDVVLGDARLSLERELARKFDVLALDAFSGDAVPVHLLTREAFEVYQKHLNEGGVIAVHVSNRYLDLKPVVTRVARELGFDIRLVEAYHESDDSDDIAASDWLLVTTDKSVFDRPQLREVAEPLPPYADFPLWTDTYSNLIGILK